MYHDKPKPGRGYVTLCAALTLLMLGVAAWISVMVARDEHLGAVALPAVLVVVWAVFLGTCAVLLLAIRAAYRTEYAVTEDTVEMQAGLFFHARIPRRNIIAVRPVRFIPRVLGSGIWAKGCCNRMTNGLLIETTEGKVYVSPADIERLRAELGLAKEK